MNKFRFIRAANAACLLFCSMLAGCVAQEPVYVEAEFVKSPPDTMVLLPVVDARKDKSASDVDLQKDVARPLLGRLASRGYTIIAADRYAYAEGKELTSAEIVDMDAAELAKLGPPDARFLMICFVEDVSQSNVVLGKTIKVEISAVVVDKQRACYVWKDKHVDSRGGMGGLAVQLVPMQSMAIGRCIDELVVSLPKKH